MSHRNHSRATGANEHRGDNLSQLSCSNATQKSAMKTRPHDQSPSPYQSHNAHQLQAMQTTCDNTIKANKHRTTKLQPTRVSMESRTTKQQKWKTPQDTKTSWWDVAKRPKYKLQLAACRHKPQTAKGQNGFTVPCQTSVETA